MKWSKTREHIFSCFLPSVLSLSFISVAYISTGSVYRSADQFQCKVFNCHKRGNICKSMKMSFRQFVASFTCIINDTWMKYNKYQALMWHMMRVLVPILDLAFFLSSSAPRQKKIWIRIPASFFFLQTCWLASCVTPGAILHQSPKTVFSLHLFAWMSEASGQDYSRCFWGIQFVNSDIWFP